MTTLVLGVAVSESRICGTGRLRPSGSDNASAEYMDANRGAAHGGMGSIQLANPASLPEPVTGSSHVCFRHSRTLVLRTGVNT